MKKTMLTLAGLLLMGVAVNAQSDSVKNNVPDNYSEMNQPETSGTVTQQPDRVRVQASDLPASMRQTLSGAQYKGWETAPIYMNKSTNQYSLDLQNNGTTRTYTFDQNGKPVTGAASSGVSSSTNTTTDNSSTYSSKNTSSKNSSTGGNKSSTTRVHKSSQKKSSSPNTNSSSSTTTKSSSSSTTGTTPVTK